MKSLIIIVTLALGYSVLNMFQHNASAATYKTAFVSVMKQQNTPNLHQKLAKRSPAIVKTKK